MAKSNENPRLYYHLYELGSGKLGYRYYKSDQPDGFIPEAGITPDLLVFPESDLENVMRRLSEKGIVATLTTFRDDDGKLAEPDDELLARESEMDY